MSIDGVRAAAARRLIGGALAAVSASARWHPEARALARGVEVIRDVPYRDGGDPAHTLDLYRPVGVAAGPDGHRPPLPVVLYVHGGGFTILSKDSHWMFGYHLARRGFLVASINYRLAPQHPFPAAPIDAAAALRWVAHNARAFGGDRDRLVIAGESAGANLALVLTIACCWRRDEPWAREVYDLGVVPRAVLPAAGFLQVSAPERYLDDGDLHPVVRSRIAAICRAYLPAAGPGTALADPLCVLETAGPPSRDLPPVHALCGDLDPVLDDTVRLGPALARLGDAHEVAIYRGGVHAFHALFWVPPGPAAWQGTEDFLVRHVPGARRYTT